MMFLKFSLFVVVVPFCMQSQMLLVKGQFIALPEKRFNFTTLEAYNSLPPCDHLSTCVPISVCPMLDDLLDQTCLGSNKYFRRLNALTCGHSAAGEALVCCPAGGAGAGAGACGARLVLGGADYRGLGAQPWVARVGFKSAQSGRMRYPCGGAVVSRRAVLTAAHCALAKADGFKLVSVLVGEWDTSSSPDCADAFCAPEPQEIAISELVVHPEYDRDTYRHDIAVIVLRGDIRYTVASAPLCLAETSEGLSEGNAMLVGWGKLSGQDAQPPMQQQLVVPMLPLERCETVFSSLVPIHEGQLCAGGEEGKDACSGFGGSPLIVKQGDRYVQVGIVSFGSDNCGSAGVPSVYTNVALYSRWVQANAPMDQAR